jgi:hypothetical protein
MKDAARGYRSYERGSINCGWETSQTSTTENSRLTKAKDKYETN